MTNYRNFSFKKLNTPEFRHLKLLIFWVFYAIFFFAFEAFENRSFNVIECPLDYKIPFCEFFFIPYVFWYIYLFGSLIYLLFFDVPNFKKAMYFIIITYSIAFFTYLVYPSVQELRPTEFTRDNIFTDAVKQLYLIDTNTNVFPSIHVIGSIAAFFGLWNSRHFSKWHWRIISFVTAVSICLSTVFLKQHSVLDLIYGVILSLCFFPFTFKFKRRKST